MIKKYVFPSMAANASTTVPAWGNFIRCITGNASFRIEGYKLSAKIVDFDGIQAGFSISRVADYQGTLSSFTIDNITVTNGSTVQTVELLIGDGDVTDNRLVGTINVAGGIYSKPFGEDTSDGYGTVTVANTATTIKTATTQGGRCIVQNCGSVAVAIGWNASVTFANGIILEPKSSGSSGGSVEVSAGVLIVGIAASSTADVRYMSGKFA